jgi:nitroreductase
MDVFLAVASRREVRDYDPRPLSEDAVRRILEAGRLAGSSRNRQARRFLVVADRGRVERAAEAVYTPRNLLGAALVVAIVVRGKGPLAFDAGRAAQNMMLVAWNDGIGSCPNGIADPDRLHEALDLDPADQVPNLLTFGYPRQPLDPARRTPEEWLARADRLPLDEVVQTL